jgi:hypothetical protein
MNGLARLLAMSDHGPDTSGADCNKPGPLQETRALSPWTATVKGPGGGIVKLSRLSKLELPVEELKMNEIVLGPGGKSYDTPMVL